MTGILVILGVVLLAAAGGFFLHAAFHRFGHSKPRAMESADQAEVKVVAPALDSKTHFWTSDSDDAIARAEEIQQETVERMGEDDVDAVGDTSQSDPLLALQDALATFPADEIVIVTHPEDDRNWAEADLLEQAEGRFSLPVRRMEAGAS
jgi:hypothetical protein